MATIIGTDASGNVLLVSQGQDKTCMPTQFNGMPVTVYSLTDAQNQAYNALPSNRGGSTFDGNTFTALAPTPPPPLNPRIVTLKAALSAAASSVAVPVPVQAVMSALLAVQP